MEESKKTMQNYVEETPAVVAKNVARSAKLTAPLVDEFVKGGYKDIWIIACGSSYNASYCARPLMRKVLGMEVKVVTPFFFNYYEDDLKADDFVFVISQSGCSTNSIMALDHLRKMGRRAIGLTGNLDSDFRDHADLLVDYGVGIEKVGYVTKGVVTLAEFLMLFALEAGRRLGTLTAAKVQSYKDEILAAAKAHVQVQADTWKFIERHYKALTAMSVVYSCAGGSNYGVALEGALKIGETIGVPSFAYDAEEFIHGPNLQMTPNYTVFFVDSADRASARVREIYKGVRQITDRAFIITDRATKDPNALVVKTRLDPLVAPLAYLPFYELISYKVTEDIHRWRKHPLMAEVKAIAKSKTASYKTNDVD